MHKTLFNKPHFISPDVMHIKMSIDYTLGFMLTLLNQFQTHRLFKNAQPVGFMRYWVSLGF